MGMNLKNRTFGVKWSDKRYYGKDAEFYFTAFNKSKYLDKNAIPHYFLWDTHFSKIDTLQKYTEHLIQCKEHGVKYICQTDFSCWFDFEEQRKKNVIKNLEYYKKIVEFGFSPILNFNTIFHDYFDTYKHVLQKEHFAIVCDFNHNEDKYIEYEYRNFKKLLEITNTKNIVIFTNKKSMVLKEKHCKLFELFDSRNMSVTHLPTELSLLGVKKRLGIIKTGVKQA